MSRKYLFGDRIKAEMVSRNISYADLAKSAGLDYARVHLLVNNKVSNPSFESIVRISEALDVSLEWLVYGRNKKAAS